MWHHGGSLEGDAGLGGGGGHQIAGPGTGGPLPRHLAVEHRPLSGGQRGHARLAGLFSAGDHVGQAEWHDHDRRSQSGHLAVGDRCGPLEHVEQRFLPALEPDRGIGIEPVIHQHRQSSGFADPVGPLPEADAAPGCRDRHVENGFPRQAGCLWHHPVHHPEHRGGDREETAATPPNRGTGRRHRGPCSRLRPASG